MNRAYIIASSLAVAVFAAFAQDAATTIAANAMLKDGSSVKGEFCTERVTGSTIFTEELKLDPAIVKSFTFTGANGESKVELKNGDKFAMTVANESFKIKSLLGELAIPRANFRAISLSARKTAAGGSDEGLVFYCTFDDEAALATPVLGPAVKLELGSIASDKGRTGGALYVNSGIAGAQVTFPEGTFGKEGCIEFWAKLTSGKTEFSTGGDPRFFRLSDKNRVELAHLEFASNNGCGNSGFGGHICGLRAQTSRGFSYMMPYSAVFKGEDYNAWHHYAYVWTPDCLKILIDGKVVCSGFGQYDSSTLCSAETILDIPLNREYSPSHDNKSPFLMDDLKIWNYAKTEFSL